MTAKWWWALGLMGLLTACETNKPPGPRGLLAPDGTPLGPAPARPATSAAPDSPEPWAPSDSFFEGSGAREADTLGARPSDSLIPPPPSAPATGPAGGSGIGAGTGSRDAPAVAAGASAGRDLSRELVALLGAPAPCLDLGKVADHGGRLEIVLQAMVMPSGRVSRADVRAPHQPPEALDCLKERLLSASLAPDVPGAPVSVQATVPVEVVAQGPRTTGTPQSSAVGTVAPTSTDEVAQPDGAELAQPSE
jgi:hypothetical protein